MAGFLDELKSNVLTADDEADLRHRMKELEEQCFELWVEDGFNRLKGIIIEQVRTRKQSDKETIEGVWKFNEHVIRTWANSDEHRLLSFLASSEVRNLLNICEARNLESDVIHICGKKGCSRNAILHFPDAQAEITVTTKGFFKYTHQISVKWAGWAYRFYERLRQKTEIENIQTSFYLHVETGGPEYYDDYEYGLHSIHPITFPADRIIVKVPKGRVRFSALLHYKVTL